jgi:hypothetical protein
MEYTISFKKSNEDIPCLSVYRNDTFSLMGGLNLVNIITGDKAVKLWEELTERKKEVVKGV